MNTIELQKPIEYLKGVGPAKADILKKELGIHFYKDLLFYFPYKYIDRTVFHKISELTENSGYVQLKGKISNKYDVGKLNNKRLCAEFTDSTQDSVELIWFKPSKYIEEKLKYNVEYILYGRVSWFNGNISISHPEIEPWQGETAKQAKLMPLYNTSELMKIKYLDSKAIAKLTFQLLKEIYGTMPETLSQEIIEKNSLYDRNKAFVNIHHPVGNEQLSKALYRLKFEELFFLQMNLLKNKINTQHTIQGNIFEKVGNYFNTFYNQHLPFTLTEAQKKVIKEIRNDCGSGKQMNRLLQGDVGSGKTMVAFLTMLIALDNGFQACMMAPTEILAQQHYETLKKWCDQLGIEIFLLTGSTKKSNKNKIQEFAHNGYLKILIGTHSLIEDTVQFQNLGYVVIDEQHRFGVEQRSKLWKKNNIPPHILVMTATPIPRTLAMTLYGDLDVSVIDQLPVGRKKILTQHRSDKARLQVFGFIRKEIEKGRQVYIVYPLIKESEKMDYKDLMDGFESISREFPEPNYHISIVHGKQKQEDRDNEMQRFVQHKTQIMVATTVIEVGVNVPNASIMIIESAERFGLSQLHQLRGRVGRGEYQSYCVLMSGVKLSKDAKLRLDTMVATTDGFEIAEVDLKLRGPGDIQGTKQSGVLDLKIADLSKDNIILEQARKEAVQLLEDDFNLEKSQNSDIKNQLVLSSKNSAIWSKIS
jgi:ATP-dependent DNA helicase RecG